MGQTKITEKMRQTSLEGAAVSFFVAVPLAPVLWDTVVFVDKPRACYYNKRVIIALVCGFLAAPIQ